VWPLVATVPELLVLGVPPNKLLVVLVLVTANEVFAKEPLLRCSLLDSLLLELGTWGGAVKEALLG
jgi:hypothetical protein